MTLRARFLHRYLLCALTGLSLAACAESQLALHMAKQIKRATAE